MNRALSQLKRVASVFETLWLAIAHAGFLWRRIADYSLTEPLVLARWFGALLLVAVFVAMRRAGSRRSSRALLVFWLLVAVLHATAPASEPVLDAGGNLALILQTGLVVLPAGLVLAALLVSLNRPDRRSTPFVAHPSFAWSAFDALPDAARAPPAC